MASLPAGAISGAGLSLRACSNETAMAFSRIEPSAAAVALLFYA
jgi:hypothetical protein